jgi:hypothetical protein
MILAIVLGLVGALFLWMSRTNAPFRKVPGTPTMEYPGGGHPHWRIRDGVADNDVHTHMTFVCFGSACLAAAAMRLYDLYG